MLQTQKLWKLEEVEAKVREEPEWEIIVGLSGEALRSPVKGTNFTQINFLTVCIYLDSSPLSGLLYQKLFGC